LDFVALGGHYFVGDFIEAGGHAGHVLNFTVRYTMLRTPSGQFITVPNSRCVPPKRFLSGYVDNYVDVPLAARSDLPRAQAPNTRPRTPKWGIEEGILRSVVEDSRAVGSARGEAVGQSQRENQRAHLEPAPDIRRGWS
jgi:hypothetical protein